MTSFPSKLVSPSRYILSLRWPCPRPKGCGIESFLHAPPIPSFLSFPEGSASSQYRPALSPVSIRGLRPQPSVQAECPSSRSTTGDLTGWGQEQPPLMLGETRGTPPWLHLLPSLAPPRVFILKPDVVHSSCLEGKRCPEGSRALSCPSSSHFSLSLPTVSHGLFPAFIWIPCPPSESPSAECPAAIGPHLPQWTSRPLRKQILFFKTIWVQNNC